MENGGMEYEKSSRIVKARITRAWISQRGRIVIVIKGTKVIRQKSSWSSRSRTESSSHSRLEACLMRRGRMGDGTGELGNPGANLYSPDSIYLLYPRTSERFTTSRV